MMAFCNKVSNQPFFRQTIFNNNNPLLQLRSLSSSSRLFVGGLSFGTDAQQLKEAFSCFGNVTNANVVLNRDTGKSRGFGFVNFENAEDASTALSGLDGQELNGRKLSISYATDDRRPARFVNHGNDARQGGPGGQGDQ